ncbi:thiamine ABC transporter substrate binding subunit [Limoniibacter endophyticus]|uniref:ABC transporter substrate-binding protein n=1 Tax=Limoniibacter endophyticus TaxID=1565040 RepID=A0A8J3DHW7_9HYPH|nr:thiamine ABC transporter substrate binding subunit [Limoniibacter endophyticus]GHC73507.1 ABC transporter substrate-binding protein [Limoniibacter endophyticus]
MRRSIPLAFAGLVFGSSAMAQDLTIYTYESFNSDWGPGPKVKQAFEAECGCRIDFVAVSDGVALLNRIKLEGVSSRADIVLGLDTNLTDEARSTGLFVPHAVATDTLSLPNPWIDDTFLPFDYGYFAVVYDSEKLKNPPKSLKDLVEGDPGEKIILQDPRTSTPGLGFLLWIKAVYGDSASTAWQKLEDRVLTVTPGWSEAYGLFTRGEAPMVVSYTTSPAYHLIADNEDRYKAAAFEEGHYLQIEVAALTKKGADNSHAKAFMTFLTNPQFQDIIPQTQWMLPAARTSKPLPAAFETLVNPTKALEIAPGEVARNRAAWIDEWLQAMSR